MAISTKIVLDGESEYRKAMANITQQQKTLKAEMEQTTSAYDKNTSAEKKNADQTQYLAKQHSLQSEKISKLREMVDKASAAYGANDNRTLKLRASLAKAETEQNNMNGAMSKGASAATQNASSMASVATAIAAATAAIGVLRSAYESLSGTMEDLDNLQTTSNQSGFSTETIQEWQYASEMVDVSVEDIISSARKMKKNMESSPESFQKLGVAVTDSSGSMRNATSVFNDTIAALGRIENPTERDQAAMDIFGKSADELAGIIDDSGKSLNSYMSQAQSLGLVLDGGTLKAVNKTKDAVDSAKAAWEAAKTSLNASVLQALSPIIITVANAVVSFSSGLASLPPAAQTAIAAITTLTAGFVAVTVAVKGFAVIKTLTTTLPAIATALTTTGASSTAAAAGITSVGTASAGSSAGVSTLATSMTALSAGATGFVGLGVGFATAAAGVLLVANAAVKLSEAQGSVPIMAGLAVGIIALGAAAAAAGKALTAGAAGLIAFGAAVVLIGAGVGAATAGIGAMMDGFASYNRSVASIAKNGDRISSAFNDAASSERSMAASSSQLGASLATVIGPIGKIATKTGAASLTMTAYAASMAAASVSAATLAASLKTVYNIMSKMKGGSYTSGGTGVKNYATAMDQGTILHGATIFGSMGGNLLRAGEVGSETVVGTGSLLSMIRGAVNSAVTNNYGGATINVYGDGQSSGDIADRVLELVNNQNRIRARMGAH